MTHEQMLNLTKAELNDALTPYMGGFTAANLKKTAKEKLVEMLEGYINNGAKKSSGKPKSVKAKDVVLNKIDSDGGATTEELVAALQEFSPDRYGKDEKKAAGYVAMCISDQKNPKYAGKRGAWAISFDKETKKYRRVR